MLFFALLISGIVLAPDISAQNMDPPPLPPPPPDGDKIMLAPPDADRPFSGNKGFHGEMGHPQGRFASPVIRDPEQLQQLLDNIGVSKETSAKIITISKNFFKSLDGKIIKVQRFDLDIREELMKDKPDLKAIQNLINNKLQVFGEIELSQIKRDLDIKALLSDTEFEKWKKAVMHKMGFKKGNMPQRKNTWHGDGDHSKLDK